jgi:Predicted periplasmic or secreted lipoprotein
LVTGAALPAFGAEAQAPRAVNEVSAAVQGRERGDGWLELKIRGLLLLRSDVSARGTGVTVEDGVVTLTGVAHTEAQRELVEAIARNVEGVRGVRNEIRVDASAVPKEGGGE